MRYLKRRMMIADFLNTTLLLHHRDGNVLTVDVPVLGVALDCVEILFLHQQKLRACTILQQTSLLSQTQVILIQSSIC